IRPVSGGAILLEPSAESRCADDSRASPNGSVLHGGHARAGFGARTLGPIASPQQVIFSTLETLEPQACRRPSIIVGIEQSGNSRAPVRHGSDQYADLIDQARVQQ